jgi:hypothetical protein
VIMSRLMFKDKGKKPAGTAADITTGLVSKWMFSEGSGATIADSAPVPKSNIAIVSAASASTWGTGWYFFDGSTGTGYGHAADHAAYNFGTAMTAFGWSKVTSPAAAGLICFGQYDFGTTPGQRSWAILVGPANQKLNVILVDSSSQSVRKSYLGTAVVFGDFAWHSLAFVWNGSTLKLYTDGVPDAVSSFLQDDAVTSLQNSTAELSFAGGLNNGTISSQLPIYLQRIYLYNVAKTDADIAALHALGNAP